MNAYQLTVRMIKLLWREIPLKQMSKLENIIETKIWYWIYLNTEH